MIERVSFVSKFADFPDREPRDCVVGILALEVAGNLHGGHGGQPFQNGRVRVHGFTVTVTVPLWPAVAELQTLMFDSAAPMSPESVIITSISSVPYMDDAST